MTETRNDCNLAITNRNSFFRAPAIPQVTTSRSESISNGVVRPTHLRDSRIALGISQPRSQGEPVALIKQHNK